MRLQHEHGNLCKLSVHIFGATATEWPYGVVPLAQATFLSLIHSFYLCLLSVTIQPIIFFEIENIKKKNFFCLVNFNINRFLVPRAPAENQRRG